MSRQSNILQIWGNKDSMNLNSMILTNIQASVYFKQTLFELKTYHEVIDEIYYRVKHLEPWEKGSRRTQGLTGMCGGVRGVGGGGIVSTAFCLLYKLYTLKLTRKQVMGLIEHKDSPYIRALGFMYVRYTQNPQDLFYWYEDYLDDEEEIDVKAGGGMTMTIGQMLRQWLLRLEWFDTLFPRIPIPIQNEIMSQLRDRYGHRIDAEGNVAPASGGSSSRSKRSPPPRSSPELEPTVDNDRHQRKKARSPSPPPVRSSRTNRSRSKSPHRNGRNRSSRSSSRRRSRSRSVKRKKSHRSKSRSRSREKARASVSPKRQVPRRSKSKSRSRSKSRDDSDRHRHHHNHRHGHKSSHKSHKHHKRDREEKNEAARRSRSKTKSKSRSRTRSGSIGGRGGESEPGEIRSERPRDHNKKRRSRDRD